MEKHKPTSTKPTSVNAGNEKTTDRLKADKKDPGKPSKPGFPPKR